jgi:hypothetical protein
MDECFVDVPGVWEEKLSGCASALTAFLRLNDGVAHLLYRDYGQKNMQAGDV